jgi:hypothetical protein
MPASEDNGGPYKVHCSAAIAKALRQLQRRAKREGRGEAALSAFRQIVQRLGQAPFDLGEPLYRLPVLRMQVRCCSVRPLAVDFAVCEDRPLVFIKGVTLLSDNP